MNFKNCVEVKVKLDASGLNTRKASQRAKAVKMITSGTPVSIKYLNRTFVKQLESVGCVVRNGITGGCYGARDGSSSEGYSVWIDASELPEREIDTDLDGKNPYELVNIFKLIENYGGELVEDLDGDVFTESCEDLGLTVSRNNTYNYAGQDAETPSFKVDADFAVIEGKGNAYLSIKFHCGGDIRGNYTDRVVYKFGSVDDIYGVIYPTTELSQEVEA